MPSLRQESLDANDEFFRQTWLDDRIVGASLGSRVAICEAKEMLKC
jgi:hypothetical protein